MKSPPWTRRRHPPGRKAQWVRIVPISAKWPYGRATRPHPNSNKPRAATFSSCGDLGTRGASSRSQYQHSERWRKWDGYPRSSVAGSGAVPNGRPRNQPYGPTLAWTTSATSRWLARSDRSGPSMGWQSWRSPAYCGWARPRPSVGGAPGVGAWRSARSRWHHASYAGGWGSMPKHGWAGWMPRGPRPLSLERNSVRRGQRTCSRSWLPRSGAATTPTPGGTHGGGGAPRPCDGWGYPSSG